MMKNDASDLQVGPAAIHQSEALPAGDYVEILGELYYRIGNYDQMPPFFMTLVSSSDHWLFISSTGGLTAGRRDADSALFPYETDDKITAHHEETGPKILIHASRRGIRRLWEPFSNRYAGLYRGERNLYKNIPGNKLLFEEINHDLQLTYRYAWRTSERFGFVKSSWLYNHGDEACQIVLLDGFQNVMPYGTTQQLQTSLSNLLNAYKRNEIDPSTGVGIFSLSATLTDRAEPSESLKATVAWQLGLTPERYLLSAEQLAAFRHNLAVASETDVPGKAGSYLVETELTLAPDETHRWHMVADVNQDSRDVAQLIALLRTERESLEEALEADIALGTDNLLAFVASADGLQASADETVAAHHFANVLFNIMRGGIFLAGYQVEKVDLLDFVRTRNRAVLAAQADWFEALPETVNIDALYARAAATGAADLIRLCYEYLPLTFSRRHGDPSRPWNRFSINLKQPDGSPRLDYQGNWRDIFQNWEPLAVSFPDYTAGMIAKFLNATTADGYNPYRVTRNGLEWEVPEPDNPWANIGYWSDHQIIYLQKLLEVADQIKPDALAALWTQPIFAYADVPYRLRSYQEMLADWYNTIDFDWDREQLIEDAVARIGTDGRLRRTSAGDVIHVNLMEKLLVLLLAKLTNLVPEGGIWMNTQRPEWNDANNALVGKGLSVVTAAYLRRFLAFWQAQMDVLETDRFAVHAAVADLFAEVEAIFKRHQPLLKSGFADQDRKAIMDALGASATAYRERIYAPEPSTAQVELDRARIRALLALSQTYIEQTLRSNRRADGLYHAYNTLYLDESGAGIDHLYAMLEGQVAILSAGLLAPDEALSLLQRMRESDLYRPDQHTYMLYPNRRLPGFLEKNNISGDQIGGSALVSALTAAADTQLLIRDHAGVYHFNGTFRNAEDVAQVLDTLAESPDYADLVAAERDFVLDLFENTFDHRAFTGRSGTFFAFEGLGSVYWHMVSKLLLAVQECYFAALAGNADAATVDGLAAAYYDVRQGIGFNKSPAAYGAFPTDPYSHTPMGGGARQPGMTGQVKEELLTRLGELGVSMRKGLLAFEPTLLKAAELSTEPGVFVYVDIAGEEQSVALPQDSLAFTFCQTPVIYTRGDQTRIAVTYADGRVETQASGRLDETVSRHIFARDGQIRLIEVTVHIR